MNGKSRIPPEQVPRSVHVRDEDDHSEVSFRYITPRRAKLALVLTNIVSFLIVLCFLSDALDGIVGQQSDLPGPGLAENYLTPIYFIHRLYMEAASMFLAQVMGPADSRIVAYVAVFVTLLIIRSVISGRRLEPVLWSPLLSKKVTVQFYRDKLLVDRDVYQLMGAVSFDARETKETRSRQPRHPFYDLSREITLNYGARQIEVATVFGYDEAIERQAVLHGFQSFWYPN